jgi:Patatin-like phospholipase
MWARYIGYTAANLYLASPVLLPIIVVSAALALTYQGHAFLELSGPPYLPYAMMLLGPATFLFAQRLAIWVPADDDARRWASWSGPLIAAILATFLLPCLLEFYLAAPGGKPPTHFAEQLVAATRNLAYGVVLLQLAIVGLLYAFNLLALKAFTALLVLTVAATIIATCLPTPHYVLWVALLLILGWLISLPLINPKIKVPNCVVLLFGALCLIGGALLAVKLSWTMVPGSAVSGVAAVLCWGAALVLMTLAFRSITDRPWFPYLLTLFLIVGVAVVLVLSGLTPAQKVRELAAVPAAPQSPVSSPSRLPLSRFVQSWAEERRDDIVREGSYPVLLIAAPGGGIRAAYWTAGVLSALQDRNPSFARHVLAISSVSGSSVGAAVFAALAQSDCRPADAVVDRPAAACRKRAAEMLADDFLAPAVYALLTRDILTSALPFVLPDRAIALEEAFAQSWRSTMHGDVMTAPFASLWKPGTPPLFFNTTALDPLQRVVIAPASMAEVKTLDPVRQAIVEERNLALITAAVLSARFPVISPQGLITKADPPASVIALRLTDGGFADNSGAATLLDVLEALEKSVPDDLRSKMRPIVLNLENAPEIEPKSANGPSPGGGIGALLGQVSARAAASLAALRERVAALGAAATFLPDLRPSGEKSVFLLGWTLPEDVRTDMDAQICAAATAKSGALAEILAVLPRQAGEVSAEACP